MLGTMARMGVESFDESGEETVSVMMTCETNVIFINKNIIICIIIIFLSLKKNPFCICECGLRTQSRIHTSSVNEKVKKVKKEMHSNSYQGPIPSLQEMAEFSGGVFHALPAPPYHIISPPPPIPPFQTSP